MALLNGMRKRQEDNKIFLAALQGVDLRDSQADTSWEDVKARAQARVQGKDEEEVKLGGLGIAIVTDD